MRTFFLCGLLAGAILLPASSQTVMTATFATTDGWEYSATEARADSRSVKARELVNSFESGVMGSLFDSGYITFNQPPGYAATFDSEVSLANALLFGRRSGANYVIVVRSNFEFGSNPATVLLKGSIEVFSAQGRLLASRTIDPVDMAAAQTVGKNLTMLLLRESRLI